MRRTIPPWKETRCLS